MQVNIFNTWRSARSVREGTVEEGGLNYDHHLNFLRTGTFISPRSDIGKVRLQVVCVWVGWCRRSVLSKSPFYMSPSTLGTEFKLIKIRHFKNGTPEMAKWGSATLRYTRVSSVSCYIYLIFVITVHIRASTLSIDLSLLTTENRKLMQNLRGWIPGQTDCHMTVISRWSRRLFRPFLWM